ncbi:MAG: ABC transporter ATP-binding protein [Geobacteraceae bacterium]|nr:ABC transporter ATP-binding protein [Geobacteraceae bacterium]
MTDALVTRELCKVYQEGSIQVTAVQPCSVKLSAGEVIGLFGPSGSGKTTLLSILGCILRPTSGELSVFGQEVSQLNENQLPEIRRKYISFIFQAFNLFPALTAFENILLGLRIKGVVGSEAEDRTAKMLQEVGLGHRMHFLPRDMSGGQKQRVAVARALAADCPIILADEPTGNLDISNGRKVMELLKELASEKQCCVVVATHDNRIEDIFDRIVYMEDGFIRRIKRSNA